MTINGVGILVKPFLKSHFPASFRSGKHPSFFFFLGRVFFSFFVFGAISPALAAGPPPEDLNKIVIFAPEPLRNKLREGWWGLFVQDALIRGYRQGGLSVMSADLASASQARQARQSSLEDPSQEGQAVFSARKGAFWLLRGTVQKVLRLVQFQFQVVSHKGIQKMGFRFSPDALSPHEFLVQLSKKLRVFLPRLPLPRKPVHPVTWAQLEKFYSLGAQGRQIGSQQGSPQGADRVGLAPMLGVKALRARVFAATAESFLKEALQTESRSGKKRLLKAAIQQISRAVALEPWHGRYLALQGEIYYFLRLDKQALAFARRAGAKNPGEVLALVVRALVAGPSTGRGLEWMTQVEKLFPLNPKNTGGSQTSIASDIQGGALAPFMGGKSTSLALNKYARTMRKARVYLKNKQWKKAEKTLLEAQTYSPDAVEPALAVFRMYIETGETKNAEKGLKSLSEAFPEDPDVWLSLGVAQKLLRKGEAANDSFSRSLVLRPQHRETIHFFARSLMREKRFKEAKEQLALLVSLEQDLEEPWLDFGMVLIELKDWEAARGAFERVLEINPQSKIAKTMLEEVFKKGGD